MRRVLISVFLVAVLAGICLAAIDQQTPPATAGAPAEALAEADSADRSSWGRTTNPPSPIHRPASTRSAITFLTAS